jgi:uncharacterized protein YqgC (DUF456 family)
LLPLVELVETTVPDPYDRLLRVILTDLAVGLAIMVGLVGIIVPVLPGSLLILAAILVWAIELGTSAGWAVFAVAVTFLAVGTMVKYVVPGRRMQAAGVPNSTLWIGALVAVVGFFVVPVVGLLLGFVLGVYLAEHHRVGADGAWPPTRAALKSVGLGILIELFAALLATATWVVGVVVA